MLTVARLQMAGGADDSKFACAGRGISKLLNIRDLTVPLFPHTTPVLPPTGAATAWVPDGKFGDSRTSRYNRYNSVMRLAIRRIGNSLGVIVPRSALAAWGVGEGDT
jgi:hypothetical protein